MAAHPQQPHTRHHGQPHHPAPQPPEPRNAFGITALCLAIPGLVLGLVPLTGFVAVILGALGMVFGCLGWGRAQRRVATNKGMSITATVLSAGALCLGIIGVAIVMNAVDEFDKDMQEIEEDLSRDGDPAPGATDEQPPTDLAAGATHRWDGGLTVSVDSATEITDLGEWDHVEEGETPFRVSLTLTNNGDQPIDLDDVSVLVSGATNGGDASFAHFESGAKEVTGRLAPGVTEEKNTDWSLSPDYGRDVLVTVDYWGEGAEFLDESPGWVLTIG